MAVQHPYHPHFVRLQQIDLPPRTALHLRLRAVTLVQRGEIAVVRISRLAASLSARLIGRLAVRNVQRCKGQEKS